MIYDNFGIVGQLLCAQVLSYAELASNYRTIVIVVLVLCLSACLCVCTLTRIYIYNYDNYYNNHNHLQTRHLRAWKLSPTVEIIVDGFGGPAGPGSVGQGDAPGGHTAQYGPRHAMQPSRAASSPRQRAARPIEARRRRGAIGMPGRESGSHGKCRARNWIHGKFLKMNRIFFIMGVGLFLGPSRQVPCQPTAARCY